MLTQQYDANHEQLICPVSIIRGGTSRGLYFHADEIPALGFGQAEFLAAALGKPDSWEIDGLGGGQIVTSKIAIVKPSQRDDADVDYMFVQVEPEANVVDYNANCGNISSGVALFALDRGMITLPDGEHTVRIWNTNTGKMLYATLAVKNSRAIIAGDYHISGISGTGAKIFLDFRATKGAITGKLFPTGKVKDTITMEDGSKVDCTVCDLANMLIYIDSTVVGCTGSESLAELNANKQMFQRCAEIRGKAAQLAGLVPRWQDGTQLLIPPVCVVSCPRDYTASNGSLIKSSECALIGKVVLADSIHPSFMGTGSCCFAAAAAVAGTIPHEMLVDKQKHSSFVFGHPGGTMEIETGILLNDDCNKITFTRLGLGRTARKIADGSLYISLAKLHDLKEKIVLPKQSRYWDSDSI
ncbi:PrpF protein [Candidatus Saganbacteria bacterium]|nr:PrpF protein [Candidatus Saganbacteria bacterium]